MITKTTLLIDKYLSSNIVKINPLFYNKIKNVLRMKIGDEITLFDGKGKIFVALLEKISKEEIIAKILHSGQKCDKFIYITCAYSIPKGQRHEIMIEKLTEIGISEFLPVKFHNSIEYRFTSETNKFKRLQKIILSAVCQSFNPVLPVLHNVIDFVEFLKISKNYEYKLFGSPSSNITFFQVPSVISGCQIAIKNASEKLEWIDKKILYVVGPEGGFTKEEEETMKKNDFIAIKLTSTVLRTETAAILLGGMIVTAQET